MRSWSWLLLLAIPAGQWPVGDGSHPPVVVARYAPPSSVYGAGHRGVDLSAAAGEEVRSMAEGTVSFVGRIAGKPVISITYPGAGHPRSTYEPVIASVAPGQHVAEGDVIGTLAAAGGHCGGAAGCLHVGLRTDDRYLDPLSLLNRRPAILKPMVRHSSARQPVSAGSN